MSATPPPPATPPSSPPPPSTVPDRYPVGFTFTPADKIARWRPLVHWLLVIPHFFVLLVLGIVAEVLIFVAWILGVITGKIPEGILGFIALYLRYSNRVMVFQLFLTEDYPPFSFDATLADPGDYAPTRMDVVPATEGRSRVTIFFRYFMVIPHIIVLMFVFIALYVVLVIGFFAVLITGRWPGGLRDFVVGSLRWSNRVNGYFFLLTDDYPPFGFS